MSARTDLYNYADDAHLGGDHLDELLNRVEVEAAGAAGRELEALKARLVEYINSAHCPEMTRHVITGLMALASNEAAGDGAR